MVSKICSSCGNKVDKFDKFCKSCGNKFEDSRRIFRCPICDNSIENNSDFCGNCGFKLTKDIYYVIKERGSKSCPSCGNKNNMDAEFCGNCGNDLPLTSDLHLVECPDCKQLVRDDVNYCRYCGHDFIKEKKSLLPKKPNRYNRYCQNCGNKITDADKSKFCNNCGTKIPINEKHKLNNFTLHEDFMFYLTNNLLVPLSQKYDVNFRQTTIRDYFKLNYEQESHIFYMMIEKLKIGPSQDIISYFELILEETRNNANNIEDAIIKKATESITDSFNGSGLTSTEVLTIKDDYYETIETPVVQNKHGGLTKGVATLGFGIIGYAATSGVKQTTKTKKVLNKGDYLHNLATISSKYIVVKTYADDSKLDAFDSTKGNLNKTVVYWQDVNSLDNENYLILNSGETFKLPKYDFENIINKAIDSVVATIDIELNKQLRKKYYPKIFPIINNLLPDLINQTIKKTKKDMNVHSSDSSEIVQSYMSPTESGTDDSVESLGATNESVVSDMLECPNCGKFNEGSNKFCGECGTKLEQIANYCPNCDKTYDTGEKFCTECGTKLTNKNYGGNILSESNSVKNNNSSIRQERSSELDNLYELARRAKLSENNEEGLKYYNQILVKDPNSWEAQFYSVYFKARQSTIGDMVNELNNFSIYLITVLNLVEMNVANEEQSDVITEIHQKIISLSTMMFSAAKNTYDSFRKGINKVQMAHVYVNTSKAISNMLTLFGDNLISIFGDKYSDVVVDSWSGAIIIYSTIYRLTPDRQNLDDLIALYSDKILKYDPTYQKPEIKKKKKFF